MEAAEPKSDLLWAFIARSIYLGVIAYAVTAVTAFLLDYCRRYLINYGPRNLHRSLRRSPKLQGFFIKYRGGSLHLFYVLELLRFVLNLLVCIIYVHGTYLQNVVVYMKVIYGICSRLFLVDVILRLISTESAFPLVFSLQMLVDSFSYPSMWIAGGPNAYLNLAFLRAVALYQSYLVLERLMFIQMMSSRRLLFKLIVQNLVLFYTLAGAIQLLEIPGDLLPVDFRNRWFNFGEWNFLNSCYFIIVTLSTVGYGDFSPTTVQGRTFTLFIIIIGIVIFASIVSELVDHARSGRGTGWFVKNKNTRHVIITGSPNRTDLIHFVTEFFSDPRGSNKNARIVVLADEISWSDAEWYRYIAKNYFLQVRVQYLSGSVGNSLDLKRAGLETADAVFILSSYTNGDDPSVQDTKTIMSALAIRNVRTDIPIYAQTLLENSNLQTYTALTTPSSFSREETYFRGKTMSTSAGYAGLYFKVLELEYETIPELQRRGNVLRRFEEHVHRYLDTQEDTRRNYPFAAGRDDLARSQVVCLQEIQMALMSGNIKANGVGTLLSNMYLDVQSPKFSDDEPPWLSEYHLGASCELAYAIVPKELDRVTIQDIAIDLYELGLLIVAVSDAKNPVPRPILRSDTVLCGGDLAMILTYHELGAVAAGLNLVALRRAKLRREESNGALDALGSSAARPQGERRDELSTANDGQSRDNSQLEAFVPSYHSLLHSRRRRSGDDLDALVCDEDVAPKDEKSLADLFRKESRADFVPEELKGHVIIAPEGETALDNLTLLLANLWRKDERTSVLGSQRAKIVVVHPEISSEFRERFSRFEGRYLFFVEGSPTSRATWRKARLPHAKAVATTADYSPQCNITDSQTLLTLLTLDIVTKDDHNLFICSELVEERSLEYLREPLHPRRKGASLGEDGVRHQLEDENPHSRSARQGPRVASTAKSQLSSGAHDSAGLQNKSRQESVSNNKSSAFRHGRQSEQPLINIMSMIGDSPIEGVEELEIDPAAIPGAARARRSVLFSRSRYASGELLVQSNSITLLAREYIEPGFINFFTNILGTNAKSPGMKIRLVRIPMSMFDVDGSAIRRDGRVLVRYKDIFGALIRIGVTPLGIYRSGTAPALIPTKPRSKRGVAILYHLRRLANEILSHEEASTAGRTALLTRLKRFVHRSLGTVQAVLPHGVQEEKGRNAVHGRWGSSTPNDNTSSRLDEDTSSEGDASEKEENANARYQPTETPNTIGNGSTPFSNEKNRKTAELTNMHPGIGREVLGKVKYAEREVIHNLLPYVYTLPDLNTWCARTDGIYILCDPCFDLPTNWTDTFDEADNKPSSSPR
eukprot:TRINITY_DN553_c0_g1_i1.p1 TRINITY_DN553_c0_g1~~TRINITY_DN553_c0_g1_i1.p1  ORF type:complete len:1328 (-),score=151.34 TRINITY_DN553_c0_g1_i1:1808-5791(-)